MIDIRPFDMAYVEDQVRIDQKVTGLYRFPNPTSVEALVAYYESTEFDPASKKYLFVDGKLEGFMTSALKKNNGSTIARIRIPIVTKQYEHHERDLIEAMLTYLIQQQTSSILLTTAATMGRSQYWAKEYGFQQEKELFSMGYVPVSALDTSSEIPILDFQERHKESVQEIMKSQMGLSEQVGKGLFTSYMSKMKEQDDQAFSFKLGEENGVITSFSFLSRSRRWPQRGRIVPVWVSRSLDNTVAVDHVKSLLQGHLDKLRVSGLEVIELFLPGYLKQLEPFYSSLGFEFDSYYLSVKYL